MEFQPDELIRHGDIIDGNWQVECLYTPGRRRITCVSLCRQQIAFTGDHIMGWSTSIISPPDGDMAAYMASLEFCWNGGMKCYWPTHGPAIENPKSLVRAL